MENGTAPAEITTAITDDDLDVVKSWLNAGGDPNALGTRPNTLLSEAARRGYVDMMDLLISRGADVDATNAEGRTALNSLLNYFTVHTSLPALRLLLSNGADVNLAIPRSAELCAGKSPLMYAACAGGPGVVEVLLRAGADLEHRAAPRLHAEGLDDDHHGRVDDLRPQLRHRVALARAVKEHA